MARRRSPRGAAEVEAVAQIVPRWMVRFDPSLRTLARHPLQLLLAERRRAWRRWQGRAGLLGIVLLVVLVCWLLSGDVLSTLTSIVSDPKWWFRMSLLFMLASPTSLFFFTFYRPTRMKGNSTAVFGDASQNIELWLAGVGGTDFVDLGRCQSAERGHLSWDLVLVVLTLGIVMVHCVTASVVFNHAFALLLPLAALLVVAGCATYFSRLVHCGRKASGETTESLALMGSYSNVRRFVVVVSLIVALVKLMTAGGWQWLFRANITPTEYLLRHAILLAVPSWIAWRAFRSLGKREWVRRYRKHRSLGPDFNERFFCMALPSPEENPAAAGSPLPAQQSTRHGAEG